MITDRPILSLAELELRDPRPTGHGAERRFLCPFPACADHQRREHKNLAANIETGLWACKRCGASGKFTEKWERPQTRTRVMRLGPYEKARRALGLAGAGAGSSRHVQVAPAVARGSTADTPAKAKADEDDHVKAGTRDALPT